MGFWRRLRPVGDAHGSGSGGASRWDVANDLTSLVIDSWHGLDAGGTGEVAAYFSEDGVFDLASARFVGRKAIADSLTKRAALGSRTTRHVVSNFRCSVETPDRATVDYLICTWGADGEPVLPLEGPTALGDMRDAFARSVHGKWLIESRVFTPVFVAEGRFAPSLRAADGPGRA